MKKGFEPPNIWIMVPMFCTADLLEFYSSCCYNYNESVCAKSQST